LVNRENLDFLVLLDSGETREFLEEMGRRVSQELVEDQVFPGCRVWMDYQVPRVMLALKVPEGSLAVTAGLVAEDCLVYRD